MRSALVALAAAFGAPAPAAAASAGAGAPPPLPPLPQGRLAPTVIPRAPKPTWSWDRIPTSFHGAVKDREFNEAEVARLARYQMATIEKVSCSSALGSPDPDLLTGP